jgi:hypothetical protein
VKSAKRFVGTKDHPKLGDYISDMNATTSSTQVWKAIGGLDGR